MYSYIHYTYFLQSVVAFRGRYWRPDDDNIHQFPDAGVLLEKLAFNLKIILLKYIQIAM